MRQTNNQGQSSYHPNTTGSGCPFQAKATDGGFVSYNEKIDAQHEQERKERFKDYPHLFEKIDDSWIQVFAQQ